MSSHAGHMLGLSHKIARGKEYGKRFAEYDRHNSKQELFDQMDIFYDVVFASQAHIPFCP